MSKYNSKITRAYAHAHARWHVPTRTRALARTHTHTHTHSHTTLQYLFFSLKNLKFPLRRYSYNLFPSQLTQFDDLIQNFYPSIPESWRRFLHNKIRHFLSPEDRYLVDLGAISLGNRSFCPRVRYGESEKKFEHFLLNYTRRTSCRHVADVIGRVH